MKHEGSEKTHVHVQQAGKRIFLFSLLPFFADLGGVDGLKTTSDIYEVKSNNNSGYGYGCSIKEKKQK